MATPYNEDDSGKYIASTQRADGTWRKTRRVRDGYTPQEEVPVYENKYVKFFKSKPDLPPGMSADAAPQSKQQCEAAGLSKAAKRSMKRKEKRKQTQQGQEEEEGGEEDADVESLRDAVENAAISEGDTAAPPPPQNVPAPDDPSAERSKKIKNLKKKLRQVDDLQQKMDSGEIKEPTKDQLEKLARAQALREELQQLERDGS